MASLRIGLRQITVQYYSCILSTKKGGKKHELFNQLSAASCSRAVSSVSTMIVTSWKRCNRNMIHHISDINSRSSQIFFCREFAVGMQKSFVKSLDLNTFQGLPFYNLKRNRSSYSSTVHDKYSTSPLFLHAEKHINSTAIVDTEGSFTYGDILHHSMNLAVEILQLHNAVKDMKLNGERIALLTERNITYVIGQFATWISNGISVPLCESHPPSEWEYFLQDAGCSLLLVTDTFVDKIKPVADRLQVNIKVISREDYGAEYEKNRWFQPDHASNPSKVRRSYVTRKQRWFDRSDEFVMKKPALIIYTSGTTGRPKGVVLSHKNLSSMVSGMIKFWDWQPRDVILHVLPLHHVHGVVNVLHTPLACGATCIMEPNFDPKRVWHLLTSPCVPHLNRRITLFMAVPTIYAKLIQYHEENVVKKEATIAGEFIRLTTSSKIRLMVSGSAALPQPVSDKWMELTGHRLLERYGMTEIGMALSNPLHGSRIPGAVGTPMPEVEVRISRPNVYTPRGYDIIAEGDSRHTVVNDTNETQGDLLVRGPSVFQEYWNKPEATAEAFTRDKWFKTGDTVSYGDGVYRIVGRTSVDVIKSGGYKISALDVERHLLSHPDILDCAVVGLPDITWGQKVAAVLVLHSDKTMELKDLRDWAVSCIPPYQIPTVIKCLKTIPRNVMGKVNKKELVGQVFPEHVTRK